ncbi:MAG TPA: ubiquinol-cytochrome c reductase iron-sulfur subunit [Pseudomonadales bacterium]
MAADGAGGFGRRRLLQAAAVLGVAPLVRAARSAEPCPAGGPVEVDLSVISPGRTLQVEWQGQPVFVRHRTPAEIAAARAVASETLRDPEADAERVQRDPWLVVLGVCTHAGCTPKGPLGEFGGWYCFCHGSQFDTSGRVRSGPARRNLAVPPYAFVGAERIRIGEPGSCG